MKSDMTLDELCKELYLALRNETRIQFTDLERKEISRLIEKEEELDKVCFSLLYQHDRASLHEIMQNIDVKDLINRIENKKNDLTTIANCLFYFGMIRKKDFPLIARHIMDRVVKAKFASQIIEFYRNIDKINPALAKILIDSPYTFKILDRVGQESTPLVISTLCITINIFNKKIILKFLPNLTRIITTHHFSDETGFTFSILVKKDPKLAKRIINMIDYETLLENFNQSLNLSGMGLALESIKTVNKKHAMRIIERINLEILEKKINDEKDVLSIGYCLRVINELDSKIASVVKSYVDLKSLAKKIDLENNLQIIGSCFRQLSLANYELAKRLYVLINEEVFIRKLSDSSLSQASFGIRGIIALDKDLDDELFDYLLGRIKNEEKVGIIGSCINILKQTNNTFAEKLLLNIDLAFLRKQVNLSADLGEIISFLRDTSEVNRKFTNQILNQETIDKLSILVKIEENGMKTYSLIKAIETIDKQKAKYISNDIK